MRKRVKIVDSNNEFHEAIVFRADITTGGTIVISYYDIKNNNTNSFSEIIYRDGIWCKLPNHLKWEEYVFRPYNEDVSNEIINELEVIEELIPKIKPIKQEKVNEEKKIINLVMYANEDESVVNIESSNYKIDTLTCFFNEGFIDLNNKKQIFKKLELSIQDKEEILNYLLKNYFKNKKFDVSTVSSFAIKTTSGVNYLVNLSSCSNLFMFFQVLNANSLIIDRSNITIGINRAYNNYLDIALNYGLKMEIEMNNNRTR